MAVTYALDRDFVLLIANAQSDSNAEVQRAKEARLSHRAQQILEGMSDDDVEALIHYLGDGA